MNFPKFFQKPVTPENIKVPTNFELFNDEKFVDFVQECADQGSWTFRKLDLKSTEPAGEDLLTLKERFDKQRKVADQVSAQMEDQFRDLTGASLDRKFELQSRQPFYTRVMNFETRATPLLSKLPMGLSSVLSSRISGLHAASVSSLEEEDTAVAPFTKEVTDFQNQSHQMELERDRFAQIIAPTKLMVSDPSNATEVYNKLTEVKTELNSFTLHPGLIVDPYFQPMFEAHRSAVLAEITRLEGTKSVPTTYAADLTAAHASSVDTNVNKPLNENKVTLKEVSVLVKTDLLARETVGSRLDEMRETIMRQAASDPDTFDQVTEQAQTMTEARALVKKLREQAAKVKIDTAEGVQAHTDMLKALETVQRPGSKTRFMNFVYKLDPKYRKAEAYVSSKYGAIPSDSKEIITELHQRLAIPGQLQAARIDAEDMGHDIRGSISSIHELATSFTALAQQKIAEQVSGAANLSTIDTIQARMIDVPSNSLVGAGIEVFKLNTDINTTAQRILKDELLKATNSPGLKTIMSTIDKILDRPGLGDMDKRGVYDFVIRTLGDYTTDSRLTERARHYAQHLQETYQQLRLSIA